MAKLPRYIKQTDCKGNNKGELTLNLELNRKDWLFWLDCVKACKIWLMPFAFFICLRGYLDAIKPTK